MPIVVSTGSATSLEDVAEASGDAPRWYQLYPPGDDELTASLVRRAEEAGYGALVVTIDNYVPGWKPRDLQRAYLPFLEGIGIEQFTSDRGLALEGQAGVETVLRMLLADVELTMTLTGHTSVADLDRSSLTLAPS